MKANVNRFIKTKYKNSLGKKLLISVVLIGHRYTAVSNAAIYAAYTGIEKISQF